MFQSGAKWDPEGLPGAPKVPPKLSRADFFLPTCFQDHFWNVPGHRFGRFSMYFIQFNGFLHHFGYMFNAFQATTFQNLLATKFCKKVAKEREKAIEAALAGSTDPES